MKKHFFFIFIIGFAFVASATGMSKGAEDLATPEIKSTEEVVFYNKKVNPFSDQGKIAEYQGILIQQNQPKKDLNQSDVYFFPKEPKIAMTSLLCESYVDKIFGPKDRRVIKLKDGVKLFDSHTGKTCELSLIDPDQHALIPVKHAMMGFLHGRLTTLVWQLDQVPSAETTEKLHKFWETLR